MTLYSGFKAFFKGTFRLLYRHQIYGSEHFPEGGAIIAPNHASFWDPPLVGASAPDEVSFLARSTLYGPFLGPFLRRLNTFPAKGAESLDSIKMICNLLKEGKKVVIFPEGHRTEDGLLGPFKSGVAMLAFRAQCPIIPAYIEGTYSIWDRWHRLPRLFGRTACVFGSPIQCEPYLKMPKKEGQEAMALAVRHAIEALEVWYKAGAQGMPP